MTNGDAGLHSVGLDRYFTATVSAREFGVGMPDVRIFHEACRHLGDNWAFDVIGADGAGMRSPWGYRDRDGASRGGVAAQPECVACDLAELAARLEARAARQ